MSVTEAILLFFTSLALSLISSALLSRRLNQLGTWLKFSAAFLGLVTALGTDAPEISSALAALVAGRHELGLAVVFGSNIFNLAALLGLSTLIAGRIRASRPGVLLNAGVCLWITCVVVGQVRGEVPGIAAASLVGAAVLPYLGLVTLNPWQVRQLARSRGATKWLLRAVSGATADARKSETAPQPGWADLLDLVPLLVMIVLSSIGLVHAASFLGDRLAMPQTVVGTLVLAPLTGLPDLVAAIRLTQKGRGAAVVSETFNSNALNLLFGAFLPALMVEMAAPSRLAAITMSWLIAMTAVTMILCVLRRGLKWPSGAALLGIYVAFVAVIVLA